MDALKLRRGPLRRACTRVCNALEEQMNTDHPDADGIAGLMAQLIEKANKLEEIETDISNCLQSTGCTQDEYDREYEGAEVYSDRSAALKTKATRLLVRLDRHLQEDRGTTEDVSRNSGRKYRLPEIELKKFDGSPKEWLGFWGQFKKIDEDTEIDGGDKYQYLVQATVVGSKARELVESFPPTAASYTKAIEHLQARFGRDETLVEVYVRELLRLVLDNALRPRNRDMVSTLYDQLETQLRALESLGVTTDKYAEMLYPLVESCLPEDILRAWERSRLVAGSIVITEPEAGGRNQNRLTLLMNFLRGEVEGEERIRMARTGFGLEHDIRKRSASKRTPADITVEFPTATGLFNKNKGFPTCAFCEKGHNSQDCRQASRMSLGERRKVLSRKGCCFSCMKTGHMARLCRGNISCTRCSKRHYELMCPDSETARSGVSGEKIPTQTFSHSNSLASLSSTPEVLLQTLMVSVRGSGKDYMARALIDSGSQRSYITLSVAESMKYESLGKERVTHLLFGGTTSSQKEHHRYRVHLSSVAGDYNCNFEVLDQNIICGNVPKVTRGPWTEQLETLGVVLTDMESTRGENPAQHGEQIDILLGADVAGALLTGRIHQLLDGPVAVETRLGWVLMGKTSRFSRVKGGCEVRDLVLLNQNATITDLWNLDSLGITDPAVNKDREDLSKAAEEHFERTVRVTSSGRYEVSLPWIEGHMTLPSNRAVSLKRLAGTVKKLSSTGYLKQYQEVFTEWLQEGIIEETVEESVGICHYLPHRAVIKEASETTKVRPVFDASSRQKGSPSLNQCLEKGPNLIEQIPSVLLRFRLRRIGVTSDIRRAFLQIGVQPRDRDCLRFHWWEDGNPERLIVYRHRRVVFGVSASPFLLAATLAYHLKAAPPHLKDCAKKLQESLYVDNCVTSLDDEAQLDRFRTDAQDLLLSGKWDLRGWENNNWRQEKSEEGCGDSFVTCAKQGRCVPVLGFLWDLDRDTLCCDLSTDWINANEGPVTKRIILSAAHKVFDPIGFSCPVTLLPKLQLQETWELKVTWDKELPEPMATKFKNWANQLHLLREVKIPRWLLLNAYPKEEVSLHLFCDASRVAYATCLYVRVASAKGVSVQLVQAKARVAPLKQVTIPRLELLACCIGARLAHKSKKDFPDLTIPTCYWTDSSNALYWINSEECWGTFVGNRVKEIRMLTEAKEWRHVPGKDNPADLPSRGCTPRQLLQSRWWEGPSWLYRPENEWPESAIQPDAMTVAMERRKTVVSSLSVITTTVWSARFSSYWRIVRVIAWLRRFCRHAQSKTSGNKGPLTVEELNGAETALLTSVQREAFTGVKDARLHSLELLQNQTGLYD